jgi:hypothetical protein
MRRPPMTAIGSERTWRRGWLWSLAVAAGLLAGSWEAPAAAYQGYPAVVDKALGVPQVVETKIAPSMGCQLCHTSAAGMTLTLTAFPSYLISQFGFEKSASEEDPLLVDALAKLEAAEPKLWADMKAGKDPNVDQNLTSVAPPQPEYGCSMTRSHCFRHSPCRQQEISWVTALLGLMVLAVGRRAVSSRPVR